MPPRLIVPDDDDRHLVPRPWGGTRLGGTDGAPVGEAWVLSTLADRPSYAGGRPLSEALGGPLDLLVKILDTAAPLSVQVHPADGDLGPGRPGKEEAWIVIAADEGAWIRAGLAEGVGARAFVERARSAGPRDAEAVLSMLRRIAPAPGDVILLPAGVPHALGPGLLLVEVQQPADATLRLYDYGRGRPLHLDDAARVLRPDRRPVVLADEGGRLCGEHLVLARARAGEAPEAPGDRPVVWVAAGDGATWEDGGAPVPLPPGRPVLAPAGGRARAGARGAVVAAWSR